MNLSIAINTLPKEGFRVVIHGQSMIPSFYQGNWVWVMPLDARQDNTMPTRYKLGDIIVFFSDEHKELVCHRIIRYNKKWIWQASENYGTYSQIPYICVIGKVFAYEKKEGHKQPLAFYNNFIGLMRCYIKIAILKLRTWVYQSIRFE
jgi:signal peptidase I